MRLGLLALTVALWAATPICADASVSVTKEADRSMGGDLWICKFLMPRARSSVATSDSKINNSVTVTVLPPEEGTLVNVDFEFKVWQPSGAYAVWDAATGERVRKEYSQVGNYNYTDLFVQPAGGSGDDAREEIPYAGAYAPENKTYMAENLPLAVHYGFDTSISTKFFVCDGWFRFTMNRAQFEKVFLTADRELVLKFRLSGETESSYEFYALSAEDRDELKKFWEKRYVKPTEKYRRKQKP
jgi:hypothetical protein